MIPLVLNKIVDCFYVPMFPYIINTYYGICIKDSSMFYCIGNISCIISSLYINKFLNDINDKLLLISNMWINVLELFCFFPIRIFIE